MAQFLKVGAVAAVVSLLVSWGMAGSSPLGAVHVITEQFTQGIDVSGTTRLEDVTASDDLTVTDAATIGGAATFSSDVTITSEMTVTSGRVTSLIPLTIGTSANPTCIVGFSRHEGAPVYYIATSVSPFWTGSATKWAQCP